MVSAESSKSNRPNPNPLTCIGSNKSFVELGSSKKRALLLFSHFSLYWKVYSFTLNHGFLKPITYMHLKLNFWKIKFWEKGKVFTTLSFKFMRWVHISLHRTETECRIQLWGRHSKEEGFLCCHKTYRTNLVQPQ